MCKHKQEGKRDVYSTVEDEQVTVVLGVNLERSWDESNRVMYEHKILPCVAGYTSPHETTSGVFSKCRNKIGDQVKITRERQKIYKISASCD